MVDGEASSHSAVLKKFFAWMFATPAALGILSKIDERLDFAAPLERTVLHFRSVTNAIWGSISDWLDIDLAAVAEILTFTLMLTAQIVVASVFAYFVDRGASTTADGDGKNEKEKNDEFAVVEKAPKESQFDALQKGVSVIFIAVSAIVFGVFFMVGAAAAVFAFYIILVRIFERFGSGVFEVWSPNNTYLPPIGIQPWIPLASAAFAALAASHLLARAFAHQADIDGAVALLLVNCFVLYAYGLAYFALTKAQVTLARTALWLVGILIVNYLATEVLPFINNYLDAVLSGVE